MKGDQIAEIRGIAPNQNLDPYIVPVLDQKLTEFGDKGKAYQEKIANMQRLTTIENKLNAKQTLSDEDIEFLYFNDRTIKGFGY